MIAETHPGLERIGLPATITPDAVKTLVMKCNRLTDLCVHSNTTINDGVLASVGEHCKDLERLKVHGCPLITAVGLGFVVSHCKKLEWIGACGVGNNNTFNRQLLESLTATNPNIDWVSDF